MPDVIRLLPDNVINQIAAGEVIQRPASVVKELVENAVDAGSTHIRVIIKDAGKTLIKVVDNGCGMSTQDATMSLERHATSKLYSAEDLFAITSKGFRGEALASIASIAQMEVRTQAQELEVGTRLLTVGGEVQTTEPVSHPQGTSIEVRNLFFNVPARRKFLKSDPVEFKHISDEFVRIALAHPGIAFELHHNDREIFRLKEGNLRQRVVGVLGKKTNELLVPVDEETNYVKITGFVGKPEASKKTRGDQYLFVNNRYIKSHYLNHAIKAAFDNMIAPETHPLYVLFLEIDPAKIDVNVHPTKQEIKFEDERLIYNYLRVSVRHALGKYNITPTLDFDQPLAFNKPGANVRTDRTEFEQREASNLANWEKLYEGLQQNAPDSGTVTIQSDAFSASEEDDSQQDRSVNAPIQLHNTLLISQIRSGALVVDQQAAHERILYERYLNSTTEDLSVQKALFPVTIELNAGQAALLSEMLPAVNNLGFEVESFGHHTFIVQGTPANLDADNVQGIIMSLIEQFEQDLDPQTGIHTRVARALSLSTATRRGEYLSPAERQNLIDMLFACENPYTSPSGRKCFITLELDDLLGRLT